MEKDKEMEIDLVDLLYYLLRKWRVILVLGLIFLVVVDLGMSYKNYRSQYEAAQLASQSTSEYDTSALTEDEASEAAALANLYLQYKSQYESASAYSSESVLMQVDPNQIPTVTLSYRVENSSEDGMPGNGNSGADIIAALSKSVKSESVYQAMADAISWEAADSYMGECITFGTQSSVVAPEPDFIPEDQNDFVPEDEPSEEPEGGQSGRTDSSCLTVNVIGLSEEDARACAEVVDDAIESKAESLKSEYGNFELDKEEEYREETDSNLMKKQQYLLESMYDMMTNMKNLKGDLSDDQLSYYERIISESNASESTASASAESIEPDFFSIKYMALGFLVGIFLGCVYYAVIYMLGSKLRQAEDVRDAYGLHLFGIYKKDDGGKRRFGAALDSLIDKIFKKSSIFLGETENMRRILTEIEIAVEKSDAKKIHITGATDCAQAREIADRIKDMLQGKSLSVTEGGPVVVDSDSLECLTESDAAILVEQIGESKYSYLSGELDICNRYDIPVLGAVVIE